MSWDYLIIEDVDPIDVHSAGDDGWELVSVSRAENGKLTAFFKKPRVQDPQLETKDGS